MYDHTPVPMFHPGDPWFHPLQTDSRSVQQYHMCGTVITSPSAPHPDLTAIYRASPAA